MIYNNYYRWRWNETINEQRANALTSQGMMDMTYLARRYASKFENLLQTPYSAQTYSVKWKNLGFFPFSNVFLQFQYTDSDRTHDSYQAYIEGLFKSNAFQVHANMYNADRMIKVEI